jgi:hypothetical protein
MASTKVDGHIQKFREFLENRDESRRFRESRREIRRDSFSSRFVAIRRDSSRFVAIRRDFRAKKIRVAIAWCVATTL